MKIIQRLLKLQSKTVLILCLTGASMSFPAYAEIDFSGMYAGLHYSDSAFESKQDSSVNDNWGHIKGKLGKILNEDFSVEGQFGMTTNSDDEKGIATYGVYLRGGKDFGEYKPYGLLGLSGYHAYQDGFDSVSESSGSYGLGLEIFGSKNVAVTFEYIRMIDKEIDNEDITFDTVGLGFTYYFVEDKSYFNKNRNKVRSIRY